jgi:hypothetical protein
MLENKKKWFVRDGRNRLDLYSQSEMDSNTSPYKQFGCAGETGYSQLPLCFNQFFWLVTSHIPLWVGRLTPAQIKVSQ